MCQDLPGYENYTNHQLQELSYSSDRNYFCQPYIGFVPESQEFKNVRKEMVRYSNKSAKVSTSVSIEYIFFLSLIMIMISNAMTNVDVSLSVDRKSKTFHYSEWVTRRDSMRANGSRFVTTWS